MVGEGVADAVRVVRRGVVGGELEAPVQDRDWLQWPGGVALEPERVQRIGAASLAARLRSEKVANGQSAGADDGGGSDSPAEATERSSKRRAERPGRPCRRGQRDESDNGEDALADRPTAPAAERAADELHLVVRRQGPRFPFGSAVELAVDG